MRAKTAIHVEYEVCNAILHSQEIGLVIERVKANLVPIGDEVADKRFDNGAKSLAKLLNNIVERRLHRLPKEHPDYKEKEE